MEPQPKKETQTEGALSRISGALNLMFTDVKVRTTHTYTHTHTYTQQHTRACVQQAFGSSKRKPDWASTPTTFDRLKGVSSNVD